MKPPSVYVLPPTREQLSLRESASVTCLVKGFAPADVFVQWLQRGEPVTKSTCLWCSPLLSIQLMGFSMDMSLSKLQEMVKNREPGVLQSMGSQSQTRLSN